MLWDITIIVLCVKNVCYDFWNVYKKWSHKGFEILKRNTILSKCMCVIIPPHQPPPHTKRLSPSFPLSLPFLLFMHLSECLRLCLLSTFRFYSYNCRPPSMSIFILYTLPYLFMGVIYLLFLKLGLRRCNAPYTTQFWKLY